MHFPLLPVSYLQAYSSQYYINISIKLNWIENLLIYLILILFCQFIYSKNSVKIHKYLLTCLCPTPPPHQHPPLTRSNELTFIIGVNGGWGNSFEFISIKFHSIVVLADKSIIISLYHSNNSIKLNFNITLTFYKGNWSKNGQCFILTFASAYLAFGLVLAIWLGTLTLVMYEKFQLN